MLVRVEKRGPSESLNHLKIRLYNCLPLVKVNVAGGLEL